MARLLWDHLGAPCPSNHLQCAQLLLRLHNALPGSDVVEDVIGGSLTPDPQAERDLAGNHEDSQRVAEAFERFTTLWHLSREPGDLQVSQCRALDKYALNINIHAFYEDRQMSIYQPFCLMSQVTI
jgi:hypothetical protein